MEIREYVRAQSLQQAYELNQRRDSRILGGGLWLRLDRRPIGAAIDLGGLGLDGIREGSEAFSIGAMTPLRALETHPGFNAYTQGAAARALESIVGVQFRNLATVGGSIFGRFSFSDVLTLFLALDAQVELFQRGTVPLEEFVQMPPDRDVLVRDGDGILSGESTRTAPRPLANTVKILTQRGLLELGGRPSWTST